MRDECPCYGCTKHTESCHAKCPHYTAWAENQRRMKAAARRTMEADAHTKEVADRIGKRLGIKRRGQR